MRGGSVVGLALILIFIGANLGSTALWAIAGVAIIALIVLMVAMYRQGNFMSPKILLDDAVDRFYGSDEEEGNTDFVMHTRPANDKDSPNAH